MAAAKVSPVSVIGTKAYFSEYERLDMYFVHPEKIDALGYLNKVANSKRFDIVELQQVLENSPESGRSARGEAGPVMVIKPGKLTSDFVVETNDISWTTEDDYLSSEKGQLKNGDILLLSAAHATGYIGRNTSIFLDENGRKAMCIGELIRVRPNKDKIEPFYLLGYLNTPYVRTLLKHSVRGQTVHLYPSDVRNLPVVLTPRDEQESIGKKLKESIEKKIEAKKKKEEIDAIFAKYLPVDFDVPNELSFEYSKKRVINENRLDPRCFDIKIAVPLDFFCCNVKYPLRKLSEFLEKKIFYPSQFKRISNPSAPLYPILSVGNLSADKIVEEGTDYFNLPDKEKERYALKESWVLTARSGTITSVGIVTQRFDGYYASEHILRIPLKAEEYPYYVYAFLTTIWGKLQIRRYIYGAVVPEINPKFLSQILIPDLPNEIKQDIENKVRQKYELEDTSLTLKSQAMTELEQLLSLKGGEL